MNTHTLSLSLSIYIYIYIYIYMYRSHWALGRLAPVEGGPGRGARRTRTSTVLVAAPLDYKPIYMSLSNLV